MKQILTVILVLVVIGIAFYIGYRMSSHVSSKVSQKIINTAYIQLLSDIQEKSNNVNRDKLMRFVKSYSLSTGENIKFIATPLPEAREIYNQLDGSKISKPFITFWQWTKSGTFQEKGMMYGKTSLLSIVKIITDLEPYEIEVAERYQIKNIRGDLVFREAASQPELLSSLEDICHKELQLPVKITYQEVPQSVWVVRGSYQFKPIMGHENQIELYEQKLDTAGGDRGIGDLKTFIYWLERFYIKQRIIDEVENPPQEKLQWHNNEPRNKTKNAELVFQHLTEQTGLIFTLETRPVKILVVE